MNLSKKTLAVVLHYALLQTVHCDKLRCLNENGDFADWYVLYKLPRIVTSHSVVNNGEEFVTLDPVHGKWILSSKLISNYSGPLARTVLQINQKNNFSYLFYNDQDPSGKAVLTSFGHAKGVLAVSENGGFWIVHSVPKFPLTPENNSFHYPDSGKMHGQSILCISFESDMLEKIVTSFIYTVPYIYFRKSGEGISRLPENLKRIFKGSLATVSSPPWFYSTEISTTNGRKFSLFGKHRKWGLDLYDSLLAPNLEASLLTETWRLGSGNPLPSTCNVQFTVVNVQKIYMHLAQNGTEFANSLDHSKWALSQTVDKPWICVGDINRVLSQAKRGGGSLCTLSEEGWKAFRNIVEETESCQKLETNNV